MVEPTVVEARIKQGIPDAQVVELEDLTGTKDHYRAVIVSASFEGKTRVEQHRAVYGALGELMAGPVHALALTTLTPAAWATQNKAG
jgi:stress-induced morphogen